MEGYIYQIKNLINSKVYVGQTINVEKRWSKHKSEAKNNFLKYKSALYPAIRLYGIDNFKFEVIEVCDISMLDEREKYWIHKLNSLTPNGYNLTCGGIVLRGESNPFYGKKTFS